MKKIILRLLIFCVSFSVLTGAASFGSDGFLDDISHRAMLYFLERSYPANGMVLDRAPVDGSIGNITERFASSTAATGFGLTALCVAAENNWVNRAQAEARVLVTLRYLAQLKTRLHGWYFHWIDVRTGQRTWASEISSVDTAFLLAGVLTVRQYFADNPEIVGLATQIYDQVDFQWMLNGDPNLLSHGWTPEQGFLPYRWNAYSEHMLLYLLAIGSPTHPISPQSWYAWQRAPITYDGITYIGSYASLFAYQYSHAWVDFRHIHEGLAPHINWFANSVLAVKADRFFCMDLSKQFSSYSNNIWGITASDSVHGYVPWGVLPQDPRIDGTLVPSALTGSLMFVGSDVEVPLINMFKLYGAHTYSRYGFTNAFNPLTGWVDPDTIGIDLGITLLSIENYKNQFVWKWFMRNPEITNALRLAGFVAD